MRNYWCLMLLSVFHFSCGATIGDSCTVGTDCNPGVCVNRDFSPGGYCSLTCTEGDNKTCPAGSICIAKAISSSVAGCMRTCEKDADCRMGYVCKIQKDSAQTVCVGPSGI